MENKEKYGFEKGISFNEIDSLFSFLNREKDDNAVKGINTKIFSTDDKMVRFFLITDSVTNIVLGAIAVHYTTPFHYPNYRTVIGDVDALKYELREINNS